MRKRLLGVVMALALIAPGAFAASDGGASLSGAHELRTPEDVVAIAVDMSGSYTLMNDIDLTEIEWAPIGTFSGILDGMGHVIRFPAVTPSSKQNSTALFSNLYGTVRNLFVENGEIAYNLRGALESCASVGILKGATVGGLAAYGWEGASVSDCYSRAEIIPVEWHKNGNAAVTQGYGGGLIGQIAGKTAIQNCYFKGELKTNYYKCVVGAFAPSVSEFSNQVSALLTTIQCYNTTDLFMKAQATYVGWDFEDVWAIDPDINDGYPYLRCEAKPNRNRFTITFNPNGGEVSPTSKTLTKDDTIYGELPTPTREGYTFQGWYDATEDGTRIKSSTKFDRTDNQTLYAVWAKATQNYTVRFEGNGGDVSPSSKTVTQGEPYGELPTPSRANFAFRGWFTEAGGGTQVTAETTVNLSDNQILYAQWKKDAITYSVEDDGGASAVTDVSQLAPGSELTLELEQEEPSGDFITASVFCAVYDRNGAMVRLQVWDVDLSDPLNVSMLGKIQIPEGVEVGEIRVFVLSENLVPLRAAGILN